MELAKRFIVFLLIIGCVAVIVPQSNFLQVVAIYQDAEYCFYVNSLPVRLSPQADVVANGSGYIVAVSGQYADVVFKELNKIEGYSFKFEGSANGAEKVLAGLRASVVSKEELGDISLCYAYSGLINNFITLDDTKINIQIALRDGFVTVGIPLILGSF